MRPLLTFLLLSFPFLVVGQGNQLLTYEQPLPCLNKKFTVVVHLVEDIDGNTNVDEQLVLEDIAGANNYWDEICVSFEVCEVRTIPNYNYDNIDREIEWPQMLIEYHQANRINIFYVEDIGDLDSGASGFATVGGIVNLNSGGIVLKKGAGLGTVLHEMGHYFGLLHTFEGNGTELVNGDNCETDGDGICDTPADPYDPSQPEEDYVVNCTFISPLQDANGEFYRPDVGNVMSYYSCTCGFTTGQYLKMAETCSAGPSMW